ncbi:MAG: hypothetical protein ABIV06_10725 [Thermoanaerobaculia bacterium]
MAGPARGGVPFLWDQTDFSLGNSNQLSTSVTAAEFTVSTSGRIDAADVWLADNASNDNGVLDSFGGVLGWAIYSDSGGNPGTLLFSGQDSTVGRADTGLQDAFGDDIVRARFEFDGRVFLTPGTYWLALHEGAWGSAGDGSELWWEIHGITVGSGARYSENEMNPGSWLPALGDVAFALYGGPIAWQQSAVAAGSLGTDISDGVTANDFVLQTAARLGSLDAWIIDYSGLNNGYGDKFSEVFSWAIYSNSGGVPGAPLASGTDATPQIEDSGLESGGAGGDLLRVRIELSPSLTLGPGAFWLVVHEGTWLSPFDSSMVFLSDSTVPLGTGQYYSPNETSPGSWAQAPYESAFVLFVDPIFANGFERGSERGWTGNSDSSCRQGFDSDNDRLDNCFESNSGRFVDVRNTGTSPTNSDSDSDGIKDGDETLGTLAGLNLPALGTNPLKKDILVEYDWFSDALDCANHSHRPTAAAVAAVTAMFANAPNLNPDGTTGIHFIHDYGQGGVFTGGNAVADADGVIADGVDGADFLAIKVPNFAANRNGYFHYTLLPHRYNVSGTSSGQAELSGDDLIVSLQCGGSDANVSNTIAHELGHNLGLLHGGNNSCNYKPNYNSVLNYKYQFPGVDNDCTPAPNGVLDYSRGVRIALNENSLNENLGTCGAGFPFDWNASGTITSPVVLDINPEYAPAGQAADCGGTLSTLTDYNDWANVNFLGINEADFASPQREIIDCDNPVPGSGGR